MKNRIVADFELLVKQASDTTADYLVAAVKHIDAQFGDGFAAAHPDLVGAFIQASAHDYAASCMAKVIGSALDNIARVIDEVAP